MMKEEMLELAAAAADPDEKRAILRDCLQAAVLRSFHEAEAFLSVALTGGAVRNFALRAERDAVADATSGDSPYAADLEFVLLDKTDYKPERWLFAAKRRLWFMGLDPRISFARKLAVHQGWVKVPGLLTEAGLPETPADPLGFRIAVDIAPKVPQGNAPEGAPRTPHETSVAIVERRGLRFALRYLTETE